MRKFLLSGDGWPYLLVPFIPIAVALELAHASATIIFVTSALGVIPTAALMGRATEELAARSGPGIGGFLNVTFGNAPEIIIAFFALNEGLQEVVKASLIGSILGNILLVMGAAMFIGGRKRERQYFDRTAANTTAGMLLLAVVALIGPAIFELVEGTGLPNPADKAVNYDSDVEKLSVGVAIVLLFTYAAGLLFSLRTAPLLATGVQVDLPESKAAALEQDEQPVAISIDGEGAIYVDETRIDLSALPQRLSQVAASSRAQGGPRIYLRADQGLDYGRVMLVMGEINRAGLRRVALVTSPADER